MVNGEVDQAGNYLLRAWQFDSGSINGVPLHGLTVALLEKGGNTLAVPKNHASDAVAYLPPGLTANQRLALLSWVKQNTSATLNDAHVKIAPVDAQIAQDQTRCSIGKEIAFTGGKPAECNVGGCGEMLWYQPRGAASSFVVDQLDESNITEPLLSLHWMDHGRRTLFVGRFGDPEPVVPALCGI